MAVNEKEIKLIIQAKKILKNTSSPTDMDIMRYMIDNKRLFEDVSFEEIKLEIERIQNGFKEEYQIEDSYEIKNEETFIEKVKSIDLTDGKEITKNILIGCKEIVLSFYNYFSNLKPNVYKMTLLYKKIIQNKLDKANKTLKDRSSLPDKKIKAEKIVNDLSNRVGFNDSLYPKINLGQQMITTIGFIVYDLKAFLIFLIFNSFPIVSFLNRNIRIEEMAFNLIIINFILIFIYSRITFNLINNLVEKYKLQDFMWKEFPNGTGIVNEFYSLFDNSVFEKEEPVEDTREREPKVIRERIVIDNSKEYEKALLLWNEQHFKNSIIEPLPIAEKDRSEYITKFSMKIPFDLNLENVLKRTDDFSRLCGKNIIMKETVVKDSKISLFIEEKELPTRLNFDERKIIKDSETKVYVGEAFDGSVYLDFDDNPHMLIAGATGCGKGVVQNVILAQLTQKGEVVMMDLSSKGGADYRYYQEKGFRIVTDLDETLDFFKGLQNEAKIRMDLIKAVGKNKISAYNKEVPLKDKMYRKFILIDEYASIKRVDKDDEEEAKEIEKVIIALGEQARAVGIHIIVATQFPKANIISTELRNNLMLRIIGKCADISMSQVCLENDLASVKRVPPIIKSEEVGRFIVSGAKTQNRLDLDGHFVIQVPYMEFAGDSGDEHIAEFGHLVHEPKLSPAVERFKNGEKKEEIENIKIEDIVIEKEKDIPKEIKKRDFSHLIDIQKEIED